MTQQQQWIIEPAALEQSYNPDTMLLVDLGKAKTYAEGHIPGAVHLDYSQIVASRPPVMGLLPDAATFSAVLSRIGYDENKQVVAYDDEGGGRAGRLAWSLHAHCCNNVAVLNGGIHAWAGEQRSLSKETTTPTSTNVSLSYCGSGVAEQDYILKNLQNEAVLLLDARSPGEFSGASVYSARGGHIPGAVNLEWTLTMDPDNYLCLRKKNELSAMLNELGITPDKEIICYCQTHHRSSHSWLMLKYLGFERVLGYAGAWSEWGNSQDTPIEHDL